MILLYFIFLFTVILHLIIFISFYSKIKTLVYIIFSKKRKNYAIDIIKLGISV